jgi:hypothetical protein
MISSVNHFPTSTWYLQQQTTVQCPHGIVRSPLST